MSELDQYLAARCKEIALKTANEMDIKVHESVRYEPAITQLQIRLQVLKFLIEHYGYELVVPENKDV